MEEQNMKKIFVLLVGVLSIGFVSAQNPEIWKTLKKQVNVFMANDLGRNGYYDQKPIAELMGQMADVVFPECVFAAGDVHHFEGVQSTSDPLWLTNYELIYSHPRLMIPWYPILGNHEYLGNTQAVLDYSHVSRRWSMPARYYTKVFEKGGTSVRFVLLDTTPLMQRHREETEKYPDACKQDHEKQLAWVDSLLTVSKEDWVVVIGHHPIYAETNREENERCEMQQTLDKILRRHHNVTLYACGHIHNFQHIRPKGSTFDYIVNSSASLSRNVGAIEGTIFCSSESGFSMIAVDRQELCLYMIDKNGKVLHTVRCSK